MFPDTYNQINTTPTPLLTIKRPDTFDLFMQERPGSRLSCVLLIAPIEETLVATESPASDLSCFYMHTPGSIPITGTENPDTLISCVSLYHAPEIDITISDAPDSTLSCLTLVHPVAIPISATENQDTIISCVSFVSNIPLFTPSLCCDNNDYAEATNNDFRTPDSYDFWAFDQSVGLPFLEVQNTPTNVFNPTGQWTVKCRIQLGSQLSAFSNTVPNIGV